MAEAEEGGRASEQRMSESGFKSFCHFNRNKAKKRNEHSLI
jgi:hypothetical protein